ncbi:MAG: carboxypeptidase-like regulatory domain-containing protein [Ekhidna sp.]|nr:carboxypeptidase-like regulatory domain-containing protein [Ekhidna sp.]
MNRILSALLFFTLVVGSLNAQQYFLKGFVKNDEGLPIQGATVFITELNVQANTEKDGLYELRLPKGKHKVEVFSLGHNPIAQTLMVASDTELNFNLTVFSDQLAEVEISTKRQETTGISRLKAVDGFGIYEAKKNELIILNDFAANKVANNARQVFAKVPGLNIWESDFAGLQLDIAARGLGPSRTANFNTRQNGYDMSADALGYPESYYMPAMQAVDKIEIVRGAASLQYGTQFGGMLN